MRLVNKKRKNEIKCNLSSKFYNTTQLKLSDFQRGIKPNEKYRNASDSLIEIFSKENIDKRKLKNLFAIYGKDIIIEYLNDLYIKNKSNLTRSTYGFIEDHITIFSEVDLNDIMYKYFFNEEFTEKEKYVFMGMLQKYAELIDLYKYNNLIKYVDYIKSELKIGIFENIVVNGKKYTNQKRKKLVKLSKIWDRDTLSKYENLELLKQRLLKLNIYNENINVINEIQQMDINKVIKYKETIKDEIQNLYLYYEIENRKKFLKSVYNPKGDKDVIIDDLSKVSNGFLLHFFSTYQKIFTFENYLFKLKQKLNRPINDDEKEQIRKNYNVMINNYIVNKSLDINAIGQSDNGDIYNVNVFNQLSCMVITPENVLKMKGIRGNLALGFSIDKVNPDLIATISNKNIHSNCNIEYVETKNDYKEFSCTYDELLNIEEKEKNSEIVMFRNTDVSTLKPSYLFYISYKNINSEDEKKNIEIIKEQAKEAGLDIPLIIFDTLTINKNINKEIEK